MNTSSKPNQSPPSSVPSSRNFGRLLIGVYTLFAVAAGFRSLYQIVTKFQVAPLAYTLSAMAALVYLIAVIVLRNRSPLAWRITFGICFFELLGVLIVGGLTYFEPQLFADETVWSGFGQGYGFLPLILPMMGLGWLMRADIRREYGIL